MRRAISSFAALGAVLLMAIPAQADGATTFTQNFHNATMTFDIANPCTGVAGTVTETFNAVVHTTFLANGTGWGTFTMEGMFTLAQVNGVIYTGHVMGWDGFNFNLNNFTATATFSLHATGSDGTTLSFRDVFHITVLAGPPPTVVVMFDKPSCG